MSVGNWDPELTAWRRRVRGCLLGGALGDALGALFEGLPVVEAHQLRAWVDADQPLRWTDDTALQVALAGYLAGLEQPSAFDDEQLAQAFATTWEAEPHRGYGANPPLIFRTVLAAGSWRQAAGSSFGGTGSLGNGGAMRAAPVGALPGGPAQAAEPARRQAAITHAHPLGQDGAALIALAAHQAFRAALDEVDPYAILAGCSTELATSTLRDAVDAVAGSLDVADPVEVAGVTGSGIAAHEAAPAALAAFLHHPSDPVAAITFAVAMGGDTDTIAAMAGSLAGAASGDGSLPERLLLRLEDRVRLTRVADALAAVTRIDPVGTTGLDRVQQRPLTVIGAATSAGAYGPGQERAPEYSRAHGLVDALTDTSRPGPRRRKCRRPAAQVGIECRGRCVSLSMSWSWSGSIHNMSQMTARVQSVGWLRVSARLLDDDRHDNRWRREFGAGTAYGGAGGAGL